MSISGQMAKEILEAVNPTTGYFECEKLRSRISMQSCAANQGVRITCSNCETGKVIAKALKDRDTRKVETAPAQVQQAVVEKVRRPCGKHPERPSVTRQYGKYVCQECLDGIKGKPLVETLAPVLDKLPPLELLEVPPVPEAVTKVLEEQADRIAEVTQLPRDILAPDMCSRCGGKPRSGKTKLCRQCHRELQGIDFKIIVNFRSHPELFKKIVREAAENIQTPAQYIVWLCKEAFKP